MSRLRGSRCLTPSIVPSAQLPTKFRQTSSASFTHDAIRMHSPAAALETAQLAGTRRRKQICRSSEGSHGALGGVPALPDPGVRKSQFISEGFPEATPTLITYDQDRLATRAVWKWAEPRLKALGFFGESADSRVNV